jgi:hypothetical protein
MSLVDALDLNSMYKINTKKQQETQEIQKTQETNFYNKKCKTENGNNAYKWCDIRSSFEEHIVQLYFQCVLSDEKNYQDLMNKFNELLSNVSNVSNVSNINNENYKYLLKLILHIRDITEGKGMYQLTYILLGELLKYIEKNTPYSKKEYDIFFKMVFCMVNDFKIKDKHYKAYGSWKDIKYLLSYLKENNIGNQILYEDIISKIVVPQLIKDKNKMLEHKNISLCGKWVPRESSKQFGWIGKKIAILYYKKEICDINKTSVIFKHYRELISSLNKYLETPQIYMTHKQWDKIDFDKVSSQTMLKNKKVFLNYKNINEEHRNICKKNLEKYVRSKIIKGETFKGATIMPHQLVKEVLNEKNKEYEQNVIELQWDGMIKEFGKNKNNFMQFCIPCIDVSPSMYATNSLPLYSSIGMGIACSELSNIKRVYAFSDTPKYINLHNVYGFINKVNIVKNSEWGATTNIYAIFEDIAKTSHENNISTNELSKYSVIIFSDMQFNECCKEKEDDLFSSIKKLFASYGFTSIPFLIFWNLRITNNFPVIHNTPNCLKLSGNNISLFKLFIDNDLEQIKKMSNWHILKMVLDKERYHIFN